MATLTPKVINDPTGTPKKVTEAVAGQEKPSMEPENKPKPSGVKTDVKEMPVASEKPVIEGEDKEIGDGMVDADTLGKSEPADDEDPEITKVKVYYGLGSKPGKTGDREPDKNNILFYEMPDGRVIDVESGDTLDMKPSVLSHLPSRAVNVDDNDMMQAILHGVLNDKDYDTLDKAGLISDLPKKMWAKTKEVQKSMEEYETLMKAQEAEGEAFGDFEASGLSGGTEGGENGQDQLRAIFDGAGAQYTPEKIQELQELVGADVFAEIAALAQGDAINSIRGVVAQLLSEMLPYYLEQYLGQYEDTSTQEGFVDDAQGQEQF